MLLQACIRPGRMIIGHRKYIHVFAKKTTKIHTTTTYEHFMRKYYNMLRITIRHLYLQIISVPTTVQYNLCPSTYINKSYLFNALNLKKS